MSNFKISVLGSGYVGMATALTFSSRGYVTLCVDREADKVDNINIGIPPMFETGVAELTLEMVTKGVLRATTDLNEAVVESDITFICVGTPSGDDGRPDLSQVEGACIELGTALKRKDGFHVVIVKSTVPPGTTFETVRPLMERWSGKRAGRDLGIAMCPEFLKEGSALQDSLHPDRLIFGVMDGRTEEILREIYHDFNCAKLVRDITSAEMIKYCSNAFLATKISFANEFANLCERLGADVADVFEGVALDKRISPLFFNAGVGFGGSCFPKDVRGMISLAKDRGIDMKILNAVVEVNRGQFYSVIEKLEEYGTVVGKTVSVLGLAFKPGTDDVRETRSLPVIETLLLKGAQVKAYDPQAMDNFRKLGVEGSIIYTKDHREALKNSHAAIFLTEWEEFGNIKEEEFLQLMERPLIIDGRRIFISSGFRKVEYRAIGSPLENNRMNRYPPMHF